MFDGFPEDMRDQKAEEQLKIGRVFYIRVESLRHRAKEKFIIIVGTNANKEFGFVVISSNIPDGSNQKFRDSFLPIEVETNSFLSWNSHVECSELHTISRRKLKELILDNYEHVCRGDVSTDCLKDIKCLLVNSGIVKPFKLEEFGIKCRN